MQSNMAPSGMAVTPHHLASESALSVLRHGGDAIEAMVAAAATVAVVYPHMNGIGGDGFWLIVPPQGEPLAIDASGAAGQHVATAFYDGHRHIPHRGPLAALTVPGTLSGWEEALAVSTSLGGSQLPLSRLLADAIRYAAEGIPVTQSQASATQAKYAELVDVPGFADTFLPEGNAPATGSRFCQPKLARTLTQLASEELKSFYRGPLAQLIAREMETLGLPVTEQDLANHHAQRRVPLRLSHSQGEVFNMTPPTQGLVSLAILGITDHLAMAQATEVQTIHRIVEATKKAFALRDRYITDPRHVTLPVQSLLEQAPLEQLAASIDEQRAALWGEGTGPGDTVWMGVVDKNGLAVSFIQSIYYEFGSGVVLPESGILLQNRGAAFSLDPAHLLALMPGKQPFHTLNPAAARLRHGRTMVYGTMGGDGQPQTQAAIFTRHVIQGMGLQEAVCAPRWLLGRTWGQISDSLKLESRFSEETAQALRERGHEVEWLPSLSEATGHAGAIVRHANGMLEGAFDPRGNGSAAGF